MGNIDLCIRFSEEKYLSKNDIMKELKTSLIDSFWNDVTNYRKDYFSLTGLKNLDLGKDMVVCLTNGLRNKESQLQMKLGSFMLNISSLSNSAVDFNRFEKECYANILNYIGHNNHIEKSIASYRAFFRKEIALSNEEIILSRYVDALNYVKNKYVNPVDNLFLNEVHSILSGTDEGFRVANDSNNQYVLINRMYTSAPARSIPMLLNLLYNFINTSTLTPFIKASIVYYYLIVIKPFDKYNEEVASLISKVILAQNGLDSVATILPIESIFALPQETILKSMNDNQKFNDFTYFTYLFMDVASNSIKGVCDSLAVFKGTLMNEEFNKEDEEEEKQERPISSLEESIQPIPVKKKEMMSQLSGFDLVLFPYENEEDKSIKDVLSAITEKPRTVAVIIGPEGGFAEEEAELATNAGVKLVTLGKRILRTETAAPAVLAMLVYRSELI